MDEQKATVVVLQRIPRLTREAFDLCLEYFRACYFDVAIKPEKVEQWYEQLISLPDEAVIAATKDWIRKSELHPNCRDIERLAIEHFPQRQLEINAQGTIDERNRREKIINDWLDQGNP